ncbi:hypothetical protein CPB85DRAFT_1256498 [Mucidula mucida]|nr:hypothetical protein CPB85DRAFT_1256498 [Mucidula mucida]
MRRNFGISSQVKATLTIAPPLSLSIYLVLARYLFQTGITVSSQQPQSPRAPAGSSTQRPQPSRRVSAIAWPASSSTRHAFCVPLDNYEYCWGLKRGELNPYLKGSANHVRVQSSLKAALKAGRIIPLPSEGIITSVAELQAFNGCSRLQDRERVFTVGALLYLGLNHLGVVGGVAPNLGYIILCSVPGEDERDRFEARSESLEAESANDRGEVTGGCRRRIRGMVKVPMLSRCCVRGMGDDEVWMKIAGYDGWRRMIVIVRVLFDGMVLGPGVMQIEGPYQVVGIGCLSTAPAQSYSALSARGCQGYESSGIP